MYPDTLTQKLKVYSFFILCLQILFGDCGEEGFRGNYGRQAKMHSCANCVFMYIKYILPYINDASFLLAYYQANGK